MNPQEFDLLVEKTIDELRELIRVKGGEYANDAERFENFIRNGKRLDLHRMTIWAVYFNKHVDAINSYVAGLQKGNIRPSSEPMQGRFKDAIVYLLLGLGMTEEESPEDIPFDTHSDIVYGKIAKEAYKNTKLISENFCPIHNLPDCSICATPMPTK